MRTKCLTNAAVGSLAVILAGFGGGLEYGAIAADKSPVIPVDPAVPALVGRSVGAETQVRSRHGRPHSDRNVRPAAAESATSPTPRASTTDAPPTPMEPDAAVAPAPSPAPAVVSAPPLPIPFVPTFAGRSRMHERLRAKRLARVQQMRQSAERSGDEQGAQRAQYLEGMVNELHNQGLFNFGQKVMSALQEGKLNGLSGSEPASASAVELPDTDLGEAAPLPDTDLGEPAPLPDANLGEAAPLPTAEPESVPELPPPAPEAATDAPPAE